MRYILSIIITLFMYSSYSQSVSGTILDSDKKPVEFAAVRLLNMKDSTVLQGAYTNDQGEFILESKNTGEFLLKATFLNHNPLFKKVEIPAKGSVDVGEMQLEWDKTVNLDEVTAEGSLDALKAGIDKKVYNVGDDISVNGGSANDVLNNIPSIDVDQDGNVSLRGDGNVTILIDGRPSMMAVGDGQNLLDALPANSIERIEVVTNPSAKYDPDGTSGIINIVLKKNKLKGFNGIVSATVGTGDQYEGNVGLAYRNNNYNLYVNYSYNSYEGYRNYDSNLEQNYGPDSTTLLVQSRIGKDYRSTHTIVFGADFDFNERNLFSFSATGSLGERLRTGELKNYFYSDLNVLRDRWDRNSNDPRSNRNLNFNLNYTHKLKEEKGEFSMNANQSLGTGEVKGNYEEYYYDNFEVPTSQAPLFQRLENNSDDVVTTAQMDFNYIFKKIRGRMELGSKMIISEETLATYSETRDTVSLEYFEDTVANYNYEYDEGIYSLYGVFGQELGKFKYQLGARGEYAKQVPNLITIGKVNNEYFNLFPSAHLKYNFDKVSELSLSYSRRINRASSRQLNPFTSYANPYNLHRGNPNLQPEYIDSYDLGYSFTKKKLIFSFSVFHRRTKDVINRVKLYYPDNTAVLTYANIDNSESTGLESVIIYKPWKWMKNTISFNGNYINYSNDDVGTDWNNDGLRWGIKYILSADFWKKTANIQLNVNYSGPRPTPQGVFQRGTKVDFAVEKRFFENSLSIGARVTDIFNTMQATGRLVQENLKQDIKYKWLTRRLLFSVSYRIGKLDGNKKSPSDSGGGDD